METAKHDAWSAGDSYEAYMGRWSRPMAADFLAWLAPPRGADWIEIGCGTGALTRAVLDAGAPASILATEPSADFAGHARKALDDPRVSVAVADAAHLPARDASADIVASALVFNFLPDRPAALAEMARVLRPGGLVAFYVWDYPGGGMGFIDAFWRAAAALDAEAAGLDEGKRFPFCTREGLAEICRAGDLSDIAVAPIERQTVFPDFAAFWEPFTLGAGPAPGYCLKLSEDRRAALRERLAEDLLSRPDGSIALPARAWAVRARRPS